MITRRMIKEFQLGGVKWTVDIDEDRLQDMEAYGISDYGKSLILLREEDKGKRRPTSSIEQVLYHEVVHAILYSLGESQLAENEKFVQQFSLLLHQFEITKR